MQARSLFVSLSTVALLGGFVLNACGSSKSGFDPATGDGGGGNGNDDASSFAQDGAIDATLPVVANLRGKVVAPEGTVPVSNALVYLTSKTPDAIPAHVYCDSCVHLTAYEPYAYTKSDGSFDLGAYATGKQWLVVQKGQFRRVRELDVQAGAQSVAPDFTRLPGKNDAANGDTIPRIGMVVGGFDHIDFSMKKLGIEEFYRYGDGPIDIGGPPPGIKTGKTGYALMQNGAELAGYHIVLMPCAALGYTQTNNGNVCGGPTPQTETALKGYVDQGGKLYVTDYAYEAVRQTWPGFITWYDDTMQPLTNTSNGIGTGCRGGAEDTPGTPQDQGLASWLTTIGESNVQLRAAWTRIQKVTPQPGFDENGQPVTITPKVWMTSNVAGQELPATVSFEQRCGRVLFSTYHCEGDTGAQLIAQEKALLYVLLEVGVCVGKLPPPR